MLPRLPRLVLLLPAISASCVAPPAKGPPPRLLPITMAPPPVVAPPAVQLGTVSPGTWTYAIEPRASIARFGTTPQTMIFSIQCERALPSISLLVASGSATGASATLRASTMMKVFPTEGGGAFAVVRVPVRDPILDALAFSRGRFTVEIAGVVHVLPAWPEFARVVEDCRA